MWLISAQESMNQDIRVIICKFRGLTACRTPDLRKPKGVSANLIVLKSWELEKKRTGHPHPAGATTSGPSDMNPRFVGGAAVNVAVAVPGMFDTGVTRRSNLPARVPYWVIAIVGWGPGRRWPMHAHKLRCCHTNRGVQYRSLTGSGQAPSDAARGGQIIPFPPINLGEPLRVKQGSGTRLKPS